MSVTKSTCEVYDVSRDGEYATMALRAWHDGRPGRNVYGGEVLIHSSFGTFCHTWSNTAKPFKEFLIGVSFESFMLKTLGLNARVFCPEMTKLKFAAHVESLLADGTLTKEQADLVNTTFENELAVSDMPSTQAGYELAVTSAAVNDEVVAALSVHTRDSVFAEAVFLKGMKPNPAAVSFWTELWPEMVVALREEVANSKEVAQAA